MNPKTPPGVSKIFDLLAVSESILMIYMMFQPYRWLPSWLFDSLLVTPCSEHDAKLSTDRNIKDVQCPILILHAQDDNIIPFKLAKKLSSVAENCGRDLTFIEFDCPRNYGHKWIHRAPELADIL